ncbi:hypothetical protein AB0C06_16050 [Micromonospora inaquosa]|uniref:hypothetical protein n=1 Tax=Micromonospora inaquosa TaxID=2203716 RepID=UPI0033FC7606
MRAYAAARGVPATPGKTTIEVRGHRLIATTEGGRCTRDQDDGARRAHRGRRQPGQLRYLTRLDGKLLSGNYPFVAEPVDPFEIESLEFLEPDHPVYALRPADPLEIVWGFYSARASFAYPGGESVLD